ncbi:uncharacterized protein K444DRAFT_635884 [Hyaloscypha bicolor E]|uniref:Uncharacterized protein n=1 Tax=Hyaloscypha bicolor E TaxID=1095630 RepID=A0A2J6SQB6_9HELO|nr:uncharacterized protein K444DRAFT_635884 [Hyaloscypha bicolor E]PMD52961.1 hypothetical protein K444DRAFT_635884 [Hyaloscypha bicolor E]
MGRYPRLLLPLYQLLQHRNIQPLLCDSLTDPNLPDGALLRTQHDDLRNPSPPQALVRRLAAVGITVVPTFNYCPSFLPAWEVYFQQEEISRKQGLKASRLFPRQNWENATLFSTMFDMWKASIDAGSFTLNSNFAPTLTAGGNSNKLNNSVNDPIWRSGIRRWRVRGVIRLLLFRISWGG